MIPFFFFSFSATIDVFLRKCHLFLSATKKHADARVDGSLQDLVKAKAELGNYYDVHYASAIQNDQTPSLSGSSNNFTARYQQRARPARDALDEFFKLESEDFNMCRPFEWWCSRKELL